MGFQQSKTSTDPEDLDRIEYSESTCMEKMNIAIGACNQEAEQYWKARYVIAHVLCSLRLYGNARGEVVRDLDTLDGAHLTAENVERLKRAVTAMSTREAFEAVGVAYTLFADYFLTHDNPALALHYADLAGRLSGRVQAPWSVTLTERHDKIVAAVKERRDAALAAAKARRADGPPDHDCYGRPLADPAGLV